MITPIFAPRHGLGRLEFPFLGELVAASVILRFLLVTFCGEHSFRIGAGNLADCNPPHPANQRA
jgi:hypothetical protein